GGIVCVTELHCGRHGGRPSGRDRLCPVRGGVAGKLRIVDSAWKKDTGGIHLLPAGRDYGG
ncbi:MAG: hypothetical protein QNK90_04020, partial [Opitutaceae bacterium]